MRLKIKGCSIIKHPFFMDAQSSIDALRQLDINYILYVAERNNSKCKQPVADQWLEGYHQAVKDFSYYLGAKQSTEQS
jgi:hypothetical protein